MIVKNRDRYVVKQKANIPGYSIYDSWQKEFLLVYYPTYDVAAQMCRRLNDDAVILRRKGRGR